MDPPLEIKPQGSATNRVMACIEAKLSECSSDMQRQLARLWILIGQQRAYAAIGVTPKKINPFVVAA